MRAKIGIACGRYYLEILKGTVEGFVVAMEGDVCRDPNSSELYWTREALERWRDWINSAPFDVNLPIEDETAVRVSRIQKVPRP